MAGFSILILLLTWAGSWTGQKPEPLLLSVKAHPTAWEVNEKGRLIFEFALKRGVIDAGTVLSVQVPGSWVSHAFQPEWREGRLHAHQTYGKLTKDLLDYLQVTSRTTSWQLRIVERDADGSYHRFGRRIELELTSGRLGPGDTLILSYGTRSRPVHAPFLAETNSFPIEVSTPHGIPYSVNPPPRVTTHSSELSRLLVTAPSQALVNQPVPIHISGRDLYGNPARLPSTITLRGDDGGEEKISLGGFSDEVTTHFRKQGFKFVEVRTSDSVYRSNPVRVLTDLPEQKLYWGDLHSHSALSKDGVGFNSFAFARDHSNLDFFAMTEHSTGDRRDPGITDAEWQFIQESVSSFYSSGEFVTLLAYECSLGRPYGHHNVYFLEPEAPIYRNHEVRTLEELWRRLRVHQSFTVPHHSGIEWSPGSGPTVSWEGDHPLRPLLEIYSGHGQSELFSPDDPLSYDQNVFDQRWKDWFPKQAPATPEVYRGMAGPQSGEGPYYARDAWAAGLRLGTIASSDDHTARPGQPSKGLAAVWAPRLDRPSIFEALRTRQTYGTTGERIYLEFWVNNQAPGSELVINSPPVISMLLCGTQALDWVELVRFSQATNRFTAIKRWSPNSHEFRAEYTDSEYTVPALYYLRLKQQGLVEGRPAMAWSSPVWVVGE